MFGINLNLLIYYSFIYQTYPEDITSQNEAFVSEVIAEQYSSPLKSEPWERGLWNEKSTRCGLIARKLGIYPMWTKDGRRLLTTLLQVSSFILACYGSTYLLYIGF